MNARPTHHATFVIDRVYPAAPARVFNAWSNPVAKARWFSCHGEWKTTAYELDFRVGGQERSRTGPPGGTVHAYDAVYHDIVPGQRIVYSYAMRLDDTRISVSLVTLEIEAEGTGTRLRLTEQGAFLDGYDDVADREHGTRIGLDNLEQALRRELADA